MAGSADVDMISFTGSVATGARIAAAAAPHITKLNLELGARHLPSYWPMLTSIWR
jgi:lactaldehyde dehydrogenase/glycolaldehyde dehydrogenase